MIDYHLGSRVTSYIDSEGQDTQSLEYIVQVLEDDIELGENTYVKTTDNYSITAPGKLIREGGKKGVEALVELHSIGIKENQDFDLSTAIEFQSGQKQNVSAILAKKGDIEGLKALSAAGIDITTAIEFPDGQKKNVSAILAEKGDIEGLIELNAAGIEIATAIEFPDGNKQSLLEVLSKKDHDVQPIINALVDHAQEHGISDDTVKILEEHYERRIEGLYNPEELNELAQENEERLEKVDERLRDLTQGGSTVDQLKILQEQPTRETQGAQSTEYNQLDQRIDQIRDVTTDLYDDHQDIPISVPLNAQEIEETSQGIDLLEERLGNLHVMPDPVDNSNRMQSLDDKLLALNSKLPEEVDKLKEILSTHVVESPTPEDMLANESRLKDLQKRLDSLDQKKDEGMSR